MRNGLRLTVWMFAVGAVFAQEAWSQTVYKCANAYSQQPCPGAVALNVDDSRTPAQKAQAEAVSEQATKAAARMQKDRLDQEKLDLAKRGFDSKRPAAATSPRPGLGSAKRVKKPAPEYFTASVAASGKKSNRVKKAIAPSVAEKVNATEKTAQR